MTTSVDSDSGPPRVGHFHKAIPGRVAKAIVTNCVAHMRGAPSEGTLALTRTSAAQTLLPVAARGSSVRASSQSWLQPRVG
jgi:hypothetical protein